MSTPLVDRSSHVHTDYVSSRSFIRPLSKLRSPIKIVIFGIFKDDFFSHVLTHGLQNSSLDLLKIIDFFRQSEFRKRSIDCRSLGLKSAKPLEALLEGVLVNSQDAERYLKAAQYCTDFESQDFCTNYILLCHAACLVQMGKLDEVQEIVIKAENPLDSLEEIIEWYETIDREAMRDLFSALKHQVSKPASPTEDEQTVVDKVIGFIKKCYLKA